jgi:hypothetical protein
VVLVELPNENILVYGVTYYEDDLNQGANTAYYGGLLKLNNNGDSIWARKLQYNSGLKDQCRMWDLKPTTDGGFIIAGERLTAVPIQHYESWIAKLDSLGCDTPGCHTAGFAEISNSKSQISIYPNPATDNLTLDIGNRQMAAVEIYNAKGQVIQNSKLDIQNSELNIRKLIPGFYLGRVVFKDGEVRVFKFIKEP